MMMNDTLVGLNAMNVLSDSSFWLVFLLSVVTIVIILFLLFKFFKLFLLGGVFIGIVIAIGSGSFDVSEQYVKGNTTPLYLLVGIAIFVISSIIVGLSVSKTGWYRKFEKDYLKEEKEGKE